MREAYDAWAEQYDTDENPTRALNAMVLREQDFRRADDEVLEIGCETGLNTQWLLDRQGRL